MIQNVFGVVFALAFCVIFYWFMPKKKESEVTVPAGEVKQIFIIFFGMFGLCSGMFIAICKGLHSKKNDVEAN